MHRLIRQHTTKITRVLVVALTLSGIAFVVSPPSDVDARRTCAMGGKCVVGDTGPGGGVVFYDAGSRQWWGRYLEARPLLRGRGLPWSVGEFRPIHSGDDPSVVKRMRIDAKGIGMGRVNTAAIVAAVGEGRYAAKFVDDLVLGKKSDWFLPSKDELNALYKFRAIRMRTKMDTGPYWTSSESSDKYAWYQMFQDGTMFTDEHGVGRIPSNKDTTSQPMHTGSLFPSQPYRLVAVRAFPIGSGIVPPVSDPRLAGNTCSDAGPCAVGDIGPAGGVVFYDAGKKQSWGRYLEAAPATAEISGLPWKKLNVDDRKRPVYRDTNQLTARVARVVSKQIGMGEQNTKVIVSNYRRGSYAARYAHDLVLSGFDDWFLPSADELSVMFDVLQTSRFQMDIFAPRFYWSSSEYDYNNAWTQSMRTGQQFDREKWLSAPDDSLWVRPIRAFG